MIASDVTASRSALVSVGTAAFAVVAAMVTTAATATTPTPALVMFFTVSPCDSAVVDRASIVRKGVPASLGRFTGLDHSFHRWGDRSRGVIASAAMAWPDRDRARRQVPDAAGAVGDGVGRVDAAGRSGATGGRSAAPACGAGCRFTTSTGRVRGTAMAAVGASA